MAKQQPTIIKVGSNGAYVNLNSVVSLGIVKGQPHTKLREDFKGDINDAKPDDYVQFNADTASFYFIGRDELVLRVGEAITQEEFDKILAIVEEVTYDVRKPVPDEAT